MHQRSVIAFLGDDSAVRTRAARATEVLWGTSDSPAFVAFAPDELTEPAEGDIHPWTDVRAVVTTAEALGDEAVTTRIHELSAHVPVLRSPMSSTLRAYVAS